MLIVETECHFAVAVAANDCKADHLQPALVDGKFMERVGDVALESWNSLMVAMGGPVQVSF